MQRKINARAGELAALSLAHKAYRQAIGTRVNPLPGPDQRDIVKARRKDYLWRLVWRTSRIDLDK